MGLAGLSWVLRGFDRFTSVQDFCVFGVGLGSVVWLEVEL